VFPVKPLFTHYRFIPKNDFFRLLDAAEVVVTHGGVNSIMATMEHGRPLVIVPKMKVFGEHIDDHQLEISEMMEKRYDVIVVRDMAQLPKAIERAKTHQYKPWESHTAELVEYIRSIL
jgi:UDP-N-acetylglucosamine transferase subunit ALG13